MLVVLSTFLCWYLGIVLFDSDYAFTVTNVLIHGLPYMVLTYRHGRMRAAQPDGGRLLKATLRAGVVGFVALIAALADRACGSERDGTPRWYTCGFSDVTHLWASRVFQRNVTVLDDAGRNDKNAIVLASGGSRKGLGKFDYSCGSKRIAGRVIYADTEFGQLRLNASARNLMYIGVDPAHVRDCLGRCPRIVHSVINVHMATIAGCSWGKTFGSCPNWSRVLKREPRPASAPWLV